MDEHTKFESEWTITPIKTGERDVPPAIYTDMSLVRDANEYPVGIVHNDVWWLGKYAAGNDLHDVLYDGTAVKVRITIEILEELHDEPISK